MRALLADYGLLFLQLRRFATLEGRNFTWGLFMSRYLFSSADASLRVAFVRATAGARRVRDSRRRSIGAHYGLTIARWYRNWLASRDRIVPRY